MARDAYDDSEPICLHVLRTKTQVLALERARHLVVQRMRKLRARQRGQARRSPPPGPMLEGALNVRDLGGRRQ